MVKKIERKNVTAAVGLMNNLWKGVLIEEVEKIIESKNSEIFLYFVDNKPIGFAQTGLRYDYVEGTKSSPVGYLEGI